VLVRADGEHFGRNAPKCDGGEQPTIPVQFRASPKFLAGRLARVRRSQPSLPDLRLEVASVLFSEDTLCPDLRSDLDLRTVFGLCGLPLAGTPAAIHSTSS
jgi:hypothetical protein